MRPADSQEQGSPTSRRGGVFTARGHAVFSRYAHEMFAHWRLLGGRAKLRFMTETRSSLIRRVRDAADTRSWAEFVELYEPLLMSYVLSRGLPLDDARDVVQDILIGLLKALPNFELDHKQGRFRTWLWQVTRNAIVSAARRKKSRDTAEGEWKQRFSGVVDAPDQVEDAEWMRAYRQRVLDFALARVKEQTQPRTWACFEKHVLASRPSAAVAAELGLTPNAVYVNASRVLGRVREQCLEYLEELSDA